MNEYFDNGARCRRSAQPAAIAPSHLIDPQISDPQQVRYQCSKRRLQATSPNSEQFSCNVSVAFSSQQKQTPDNTCSRRLVELATQIAGGCHD